MAEPRAMAPIGVFDSGIGGLSVLQALRQALPHEDFVYLADAGFAPYGERESAHVRCRAQAIARHLLEVQLVKALIIACNTATAAAVATLRAQYPNIPIIGIEPAVKPAAAGSRTGRIGVLATRSTLSSDKFAALLARQPTDRRFVLQPCDGLAAAIEQSDTTSIGRLAGQYLAALGPLGNHDGAVDAVVLGCTHYALVSDQFHALVDGRCSLHEAGVPVAHRARQVLQAFGLVQPLPLRDGTLALLSTGSASHLQAAAQRWLAMTCTAHSLALAS